MNIGDEVIISAKVVGITESNNPIIQVKSGVRMLIKESLSILISRFLKRTKGREYDNKN